MTQDNQSKGQPPEDRGNQVTVTIDQKSKDIQSRQYSGAQLKQALGLDAARELEQVIDGQLKVINDGDKLHIRGGEVFISHVKTGGSSHAD